MGIGIVGSCIGSTSGGITNCGISIVGGTTVDVSISDGGSSSIVGSGSITVCSGLGGSSGTCATVGIVGVVTTAVSVGNTC